MLLLRPIAVVPVVGVKVGARRLRILRLRLSVCRRRWRESSLSVALRRRLLLLRVISGLGTSVFIGRRHPSCAIHGLRAATTTTTGDTCKEEEDGEKDNNEKS